MSAKLESLKNEISKLRNELCGSFELRSDIISQIRNLEKEIKEENKKLFLSYFNKQHQQKRDLAKIIFDIEEIDINDITNDRKVNKQKIKKYPNYFKIEHCYIEIWQNLVYSFNYKGEKFRLYYYDGSEQKRIINFEELLKINSIQSKDITLKEYNKILNDLKKAEDKLKNEIQKYNDFKQNYYFLNNAELLNQKSESIYFITQKH
jgi:hypothetical protein